MAFSNPFPVTNSMRRFAAGVASGAIRVPLKKLASLPTYDEVVAGERGVADRILAAESRVVDGGRYGRRTVKVFFYAPDHGQTFSGQAFADRGWILVYVTPGLRKRLDDIAFGTYVENIILHELVHIFDPKVRLRGPDRSHPPVEHAMDALEEARLAAEYAEVPMVLAQIRERARRPSAEEKYGVHAKTLAGIKPSTIDRIIRGLERAEIKAYYEDPAEIDAYMTERIWELVGVLDDVDPVSLPQAKQTLIQIAKKIAIHMARGRSFSADPDMRSWSRSGPHVWRRFIKGLVRAIEEYRRPRWLKTDVGRERIKRAR